MITNVANLPSKISLSHLVMSRSKAVERASDAELIEGIAAGDKLAIQFLYSRHNVRVFRFALRFLSSEAAAEDIVNEVFFDVWRKADQFEGRSQVSTWLLAIARNKALESLRHRSTEELDEDAAALIEDPADNPEMATHKKETSSILRRCLTHLSPAHREIIDLVYYHGKSIDEVAKIIGIAQNTVKTRMFYARKQLAGLLAARGITTSLA
jgi:RNA polymerase sigma-70 factor (ECF subfamily)